MFSGIQTSTKRKHQGSHKQHITASQNFPDEIANFHDFPVKMPKMLNGLEQLT